MPNPIIAIAAGSYTGNMNIGGTFCFVRPALVAETHEIQRPKIWERFGSAARLKAGSHPIGGRDSVVTTDDETVEVCLGASGKRLPLWARSTETMSAWVLRAAPAPLTAAAKPVTARKPTTLIAAIFAAARRPTRCAKTAVLFVSISNSPWWGD